jgi:hypothetical protein
VLVAGGCTDPACATATAAVTLYDPTSSSFSAVGSLSEARAAIASVRLADGRVLLAGGCSGSTCSARVDLYDPRTRSVVAGAPMSSARGRAEAVRLRDGRVLVTGGCTSIACAGVLSSAELYDPATDRWTSATPMASPRGGHFATLLDDGRVLVGGGCPDGACTSYLRSTELFDPSTARFAPGPAMTQMRVGARALRIPDGRVMVNQGCSGRTECDLSNEVYDPRSENFARVEDAVTARAFQAFVLHERAHLAIAIGGCQPRTCSWWNETYDLSNIHPVLDAGVDAGPLDAPADASRDASRGARDAGSPIPPRSNACACEAALGAGKAYAGRSALLLLGLLTVVRRRREVAR